jgi:Multidrug resistance efflux pump
MRLTLVLLAVVALNACRARVETAPAVSALQSGALVARRGTLEQRLLLTGQLDAARRVSIAVPFLESWQATLKWLESDGAVVKAGQKLVDLDTSSISTTLQAKREAALQAAHLLAQNEAQLRADVAQKSFDAERKQLELDKAKIDAAVPESLLAQREYQDRQMRLQRAGVDFDKARTDLDAAQRAARADLDNLRLALDKARSDIATAERSLAAMTLVAPADGIVVVGDHPWEGRKFQVGDNVWTGLTVMSIPDLASMQIQASLSDVDDGRIAVGDHVAATIDAYPASIYSGRIASISAVAQETGPQSLRRAFNVVVALDRVDESRMRTGLSVKVTVLKKEPRAQLLVPRAAIDFSPKQPRARLADGTFVAVRLGRCNSADCIVLSGIGEGTHLSPIEGNQQ